MRLVFSRRSPEVVNELNNISNFPIQLIFNVYHWADEWNSIWNNILARHLLIWKFTLIAKFAHVTEPSRTSETSNVRSFIPMSVCLFVCLCVCLLLAPLLIEATPIAIDLKEEKKVHLIHIVPSLVRMEREKWSSFEQNNNNNTVAALNEWASK